MAPDVSLRAALASLLAHAPRYELDAALLVLVRSGFAWDSIRFEGIRDLHGQRGELIRSVRIETVPSRVAIIRLNAGLLSPGSPLPAYFRDFARRLAEPEAFIDFIGFWDSLQLSSLAFAAFPKLSVGGNGLLAKSYRARLRLGSPMVLHWLFRELFPELSLSVEAAVFSTRGRAHKARVGSTLDGRLVLGAEFSGRSAGFRVRLFAEEPESEGVSDWEIEARRRLERISPLLSRLERPLEVVIRFESYRHGHELVDGSAGRPQLGVRPWLLAQRSLQLGPGEVLLRSPRLVA